MKNLASILSGLSLLGVIVLSVLFFQTKGGAVNEIEDVVLHDSTLIESVNRKATGRLALIDVQRITNEYGYYKEIVVKLESKQKRAEAEYMKKAQAFQREYEAFMKKAQMGAFLTQESQQQQEMDLRQKQESLANLEQELGQKLQIEMQKLDAQATDTIMSYLKKFNKEAQYDLILNSATILDPGVTVDVTDTILSILNTQYNLHKNTVK